MYFIDASFGERGEPPTDSRGSSCSMSLQMSIPFGGRASVEAEIRSNGPAGAWPARIMPPMVDVSVSGVVRAAPEDVFRFLADLENWPRWQSDMKSTMLAAGQPGQVAAVYRYVSKAMGMTFDSTVRLTRVDAPREVAFEGDWTGMIRPDGRY